MKILFIFMLVLVGTSAQLEPEPAPAPPGEPPEGAVATPVLDMEGNELKALQRYHIHPTDGSGGLAMTGRHYSCPPNVIQIDVNGSNGLPLHFIPQNTTDTTVVAGSSMVKIALSAITICMQSLEWRVTEPDWPTGLRYVATGRYPNVGATTTKTRTTWTDEEVPESSVFRIERAAGGVGYNIVYCDSQCADVVGVSVENGNRWLALSPAPLTVTFKPL